MKATIFKPPTPLPVKLDKFSIFLAGSIEMGSASPWQTQTCNELSDLDINIFNPRRDAWDKSWEQSIENPTFVEQIEWELRGQELASLVAIYFDPDTKSPISLMELGLFHRRPMIVCCPKGFWRKGNVDVVCRRYDIPQASSLDTFITWLKAVGLGLEVGKEQRKLKP